MSRHLSCGRKKLPRERSRRRPGTLAGGLPRPWPALAILPLLLLVWIWAAAGLAAVEPPLDCPPFKSLCVQAETSGGIDLKSGTAVLEGNVVGFIRARQMHFASESLKAFRNKKNEWTRLVLDRKVRLTEPGSFARASHAVLEPDRVLLFGNSLMEQAPYAIRGEEILIDDKRRTTTITAPQGGTLLIRYLAPETAKENSGETPPPEEMLIRAEEAVIEEGEGGRRIRLNGRASVHRPLLDWWVKAETIDLRFADTDEMEGFRAEGNVRITEPGRTLASDVAFSKNHNEVIELIGNAKLEQPGSFQMSSQRIEVYTDAEKGLVQSGPRNEPIKLLFDEPNRDPYRLEAASTDAMKADGVPAPLLFRLEPIMDVFYPNRTAFETALGRLLSESEMEAHLETLAAHALQTQPAPKPGEDAR